MTRIENLENILYEILDDYGWTMKNEITEQTNIDSYKEELIKLFSEKCCNNLILENTDEYNIIERIQNV